MRTLLDEAFEAISSQDFTRARRIIETRKQFVSDSGNNSSRAICDFEEFTKTKRPEALDSAIHNAEASLKMQPEQTAMHALLGQAYATTGLKYSAWRHYCNALNLAKQAGQQKEAERIQQLQGRMENAFY